MKNSNEFLCFHDAIFAAEFREIINIPRRTGRSRNRYITFSSKVTVFQLLLIAGRRQGTPVGEMSSTSRHWQPRWGRTLGSLEETGEGRDDGINEWTGLLRAYFIFFSAPHPSPSQEPGNNPNIVIDKRRSLGDERDAF